jgi:hypothetical protein
MAEFLKGNYALPKRKRAAVGKRPKQRVTSKKSLTQEFEEAALAKLGGSLCFVMKKNTFVWTGESGEAARP